MTPMRPHMLLHIIFPRKRLIANRTQDGFLARVFFAVSRCVAGGCECCCASVSGGVRAGVFVAAAGGGAAAVEARGERVNFDGSIVQIGC